MIMVKILLYIMLLFSVFKVSFVEAKSIEKGGYLYQIMVDIRHKKYNEAIKKLEPYVQKNDPAALFWYGYMKQESQGSERMGADHWFEKSIESGNPYSMFKLSGKEGTDVVCESNGWICSDEYFDSAIHEWEKLAVNGDVKAEYLYRYYNRSFLGIAFDAWITGKDHELILEAAKKGYYRPLARRTSYAASQKEHPKDFWGEELLNVLRNNTDKDPQIATYRAMHVYEDLTDRQRVDLLVNSLAQGYYPASNYLYEFAKKGVLTFEDVYVYAEVSNIGGFSNALTVVIENRGLVSNEVIPELKIKAKIFFDEIQHVINFDEMDFMYRHKPDV
ncbi:hypothetical protein ACMXYV_07895 [Neptuniibacter sp. SY11_33]|uniref:hypothetical protein n=1 Tax=Neptuniibacter sp. SY11_33 TaxID=3398215 RepID=UPI0039F4AFF6